MTHSNNDIYGNNQVADDDERYNLMDREESRQEDAPAQETPFAEEQKDPDRQSMLERRRARQSGRSGAVKKNKVIALAALLAGGVCLLSIFVGPSAILSMFSQEELGKTKVPVSEVSLEVKKDEVPTLNIDFDPLLKQNNNPVDAMKAQLNSLQGKVENIDTKPDATAAMEKKMNDMLAAQNEAFEARLAEERQAMAEEKMRIEEEARRMQEEMLANAEAERLKAEDAAKLAEQTALQRDSKLLIIDESSPDDQSSLGDQSSPDGLQTAGTPGGLPANPYDAAMQGNPFGAQAPAGNSNKDFLAEAADAGFEVSMAKPLSDPSRTVVQGTIISAVLETAINTELPGNIRAQVIEPVFSYDGTHILMPAGSILIGTFNQDIALEQKRVLIAWNRAITPSGQSVALGGTGTDLLGRSGTGGKVNNRYGKKFGAAALMTAISIVPSLIASKLAPAQTQSSVDQPSVAFNLGGGGGGGGGGGFGGGAGGDAVGGQVNEVLSQYLALKPLIEIAQGEEIRVFVNRDLVFK